MKNILTIVRKEFARFFKDKRLVIGTLILPGLLIFVLYSLLGSVFYEGDKVSRVQVVNPSEFLRLFLSRHRKRTAVSRGLFSNMWKIIHRNRSID